HFAGKFPVWLAPKQVKILPITDRTANYANEVCKKLAALGVRAEVDLRSEKIGYKIREAKMEKVPYVLVVGDKEAEEGTVNVNKRGIEEKYTVSLDDFAKTIVDEIEQKINF
ncbi:MAG: threonine--tRNA ligase, partial [Clostridia bacterium]|nr:threonine--tRNA ligase [Clostridia bacterium]